MKVLVDTSVWLSAFSKASRAEPNKSTLILHDLIESNHHIYLTGIIISEIVRGFKSSNERKQLTDQLSAFPMIALNRSDYLYAADLSVACKNKGIITSGADSIIASAAIRYECHLLTQDKDFAQIAKAVPLQLL